MAKSNPKLKVKKPKNFFNKPLKADFKGLFKGLAKGIGHTVAGKWDELANDTVETASALGLVTEPGELAFLLIRRSITKALFQLMGEVAAQQPAGADHDPNAIAEQLGSSISNSDVHVDQRFLDRPADLSLVTTVQSLFQRWLESLGWGTPAAKAIVGRLPSYFVYALNQEWRQNAKSYRPLIEALDTPFTKAGDREWAWRAYAAFLQQKIQEGIFDEPFSLSQIYVPLNAFYIDESPSKDETGELVRNRRQSRRVVVSLQGELEEWLRKPSSQDTIRVISGGPGSGKSSFARVFAASAAQDSSLKVLFIPLHLIDPTKDLVDEIGRFVREEGILLQNPLNADSSEPHLLIILDGLDELASQGKAAAETARAFLREVERTVERRNQQTVKLRVLISGRELIVQENESEFRRPRQILTLLPYFLFDPERSERNTPPNSEQYHDPEKRLEKDLREQWWKNYGALSGKGYTTLPQELRRNDLAEVTAQPLLNYLVALSLTRERIDFTKDVNLNYIYADLVAAVYERGYEKNRPYRPIRHMNVDEFSRVLEEIGLAAWHGDGRTTTVREIEEHCRAGGLGTLLDAFRQGAEAGVTRLLAAFFFRKYGERASGEATFVFTHKSFGEYLTARRVVRAMERVIREVESRAKTPDDGWDEREALKHWVQICGPSAITPYLHGFLSNELSLRSGDDLARWQNCLTALFSYVLRYGMPMEQLQVASFREALFQSRNAEEALLVALNGCARLTRRVSQIDATTFGAWFRRIQGQRTGPDSVLAARCLSFLDLDHSCLHIGDFYGAAFHHSTLRGVAGHLSCFASANLNRANLEGAEVRGAHFQEANLRGASLRYAALERVNLQGANLLEANLEGAKLQEANLRGANLQKANFERADLKGANLREANLEGANLRAANCERADLKGANLRGANLQWANLEGTDLQGTDLRLANLEGVNLEGANLEGTQLEIANLESATPRSSTRKRR